MKSRKELTEVHCVEYRKADRHGKTVILDSFCKSTTYCRAYAAMLLRGYALRRLTGGGGSATKVSTTKRQRREGGRPPLYGVEVQRAVKSLWIRFGCLCGKRLAPILRRSLPELRHDRFLHPSAQVCRALKNISPASIDRLLKPARQKLRLKGRCHTRPSTALLTLIPVRTFGDFSSVEPGDMQMDTVGHDGGISTGEYAFSLTLCDVCTGWTERRGLQNRAARWIEAAIDDIRRDVPFEVRHLHPDGGSEFININVYTYCQKHHIQLSRSRAGRKNDNCWVEQKNFDTIRKLVGYNRYSSPEALEALNALYRVQGLLQNYVLPSQKLKEKKRIGSKVQKRYHPALTPAQRVLMHPNVSAAVKAKIRKINARIHPLALADEVACLQKKVLSLAEDLRRRAKVKESCQ